MGTMNKTLYILSHTVQKENDDFLRYIQHNQEYDGPSLSHVFIQAGLAQQDRIGESMYGIQDDDQLANTNSSLEPISYHDLLGLIFHSDNVLVM